MTKHELLTKLVYSKFMRTVFYPANMLYRKHLLWKYSKSADSKQMKKLHNIHQGQRCFVIGNGPSLTPDDLTRIKDEYSFAANRIYCIYESTSWRPSYYVAIDSNNILFDIDNVKTKVSCPKFINYKAKMLGRKPEDNITYICTNGKFRINPYDPETDTLSEDLSKYVTKVHTVTVTSIELAIYMGFKEIYLLGVDNDYVKKADKSGKVSINLTMKSSYFKGMKDFQGKPDSGSFSIANIDSVNYSYELAKKFAEEHSVKIYNATRGGKLEVFERVDFDELMSSKKQCEGLT